MTMHLIPRTAKVWRFFFWPYTSSPQNQNRLTVQYSVVVGKKNDKMREKKKKKKGKRGRKKGCTRQLLWGPDHDWVIMFRQARLSTICRLCSGAPGPAEKLVQWQSANRGFWVLQDPIYLFRLARLEGKLEDEKNSTGSITFDTNPVLNGLYFENLNRSLYPAGEFYHGNTFPSID